MGGPGRRRETEVPDSLRSATAVAPAPIRRRRPAGWDVRAAVSAPVVRGVRGARCDGSRVDEVPGADARAEVAVRADDEVRAEVEVRAEAVRGFGVAGVARGFGVAGVARADPVFFVASPD